MSSDVTPGNEKPAMDARIPEEALAELENLIPIPRYRFVGKKEATHAQVSKSKRAAKRKAERKNRRNGR